MSTAVRVKALREASLLLDGLAGDLESGHVEDPSDVVDTLAEIIETLSQESERWEAIADAP